MPNPLNLHCMFKVNGFAMLSTPPNNESFHSEVEKGLIQDNEKPKENLIRPNVQGLIQMSDNPFASSSKTPQDNPTKNSPLIVPLSLSPSASTIEDLLSLNPSETESKNSTSTAQIAQSLTAIPPHNLVHPALLDYNMSSDVVQGSTNTKLTILEKGSFSLQTMMIQKPVRNFVEKELE
ncbi:hypothetical protein CROQUDRAFT_101352 [Cronartium quercuum f. sp. fusiforme G11]|uniref:Uncharacterized protein n=1 Tax=Cronartium quercuum f. sp. fusiforme G11 TaxID=708437 RepID=A0A9P6T5I3_9BASI|nr:hypothetical protein CROQUDRAFT_101352 [Cronartium quercuum f. sp. fusiforme G11]